jgi:hypothetical protein
MRAACKILASRIVLGATLLNTQAPRNQVLKRFLMRHGLTVDRRQNLQVTLYRLESKVWSMRPLSGLGGNLLDLAPDPQQIASPQFFDVVPAVAPAHQLQCDVECLAGVEPVDNAAAAVEV